MRDLERWVGSQRGRSGGVGPRARCAWVASDTFAPCRLSSLPLRTFCGCSSPQVARAVVLCLAAALKGLLRDQRDHDEDEEITAKPAIPAARLDQRPVGAGADARRWRDVEIAAAPFYGLLRDKHSCRA